MSSQYIIDQIKKVQKEIQDSIDERKLIVKNYKKVFAIQPRRN